ncbi:MAG: nuclear transport factor 2 family protein [bacterium]|nr:nuclear transport factor 2 family protein [bacterium]
MSYVIDCRKNWEMTERMLAEETDPIRRRNLETIVAHAKAEAKPDFDALMATVAEDASYTSYTDGDADANSPTGKDGVAAYYSGIVGSGCNHIEHAVDRMAVGRDVITTEGDMKMAYPGKVLAAMGIPVPDEDAHYLYLSRLMIVWGFDENGLVTCEDSYAAGGHPGFDGIAERPVTMDQIYLWADDPAS